MNISDAAEKRKLSTNDIVQIGIFAAIITICSWICIPTTVPFTLQTFAVFMAALVLGGKRGTLAVIVYLLLGAVGMPVFSGFRGGLGIILGSTGGYMVGFICTTLIMWILEDAGKKHPLIRIISMLLGLAVCYALGTAWFMIVYGRANGAVSVMTALSWCVFPFIIPDLIKVAAACLIVRTYKFAGYKNAE